MTLGNLPEEKWLGVGCTVQQLIREIQDGTLPETKDGRLGWKILHPDLTFTHGERGVESSESHEAPRREHYSE